MSRRITIKTKMDSAELVEQSLQELEATFTQKATQFQVSHHAGHRFAYTGCGVDVATGQSFFDEDDRRAKTFVENTLFQTYNKNLAVNTMTMEGHFVDATYVASAGTFIEGFNDIIEEGDIVIDTRAPSY